MNYNRRVLQLVLLSTALLLLLSLLQYRLGWSWLPLQRVNLVSDITKDSTHLAGDTAAQRRIEEKIVVRDNGKRVELALYHKAKMITDFNADTTQAALAELMSKLDALKKGKKKKIRIAYFGDSMIEGDLISMTFRKLMQQQFGGSGVGFVPVVSPVAGFRITVNHNFSGWTEKTFKSDNTALSQVYISGHTGNSSNGTVSMTDKTITDSAAVIEKSLLCGAGQTSVSANGASRSISTTSLVNRVVLEKNTGHALKLSVSDASLPVYGISFESESGIFVDNFSFRGISGMELGKLNLDLLKAVDRANPYDLIILQYGVNLLFRPNDKNYTWYEKIMTPSLQHFRTGFPQSSILLISAGDRAFRYGSEYKTAIGIDSLIKVQANMAYNNGCAFYNMYETMGGYGTIVAWANATPSLANKDYVHPNFRGAEVLGGFLYDALLKDYNKYSSSQKK